MNDSIIEKGFVVRIVGQQSKDGSSNLGTLIDMLHHSIL